MAEDLLQEVSLFLERLNIQNDEQRKRGELFNVFRLCGVDHYETTHSKIIAGILSPQGRHGQGLIYLDAFFSVCTPSFDFILDETAKVSTEVAFDNGRIDILIQNGHQQGVIIENKIYATDGFEQLIRYDQYAKERFRNGYDIFYLTLYGDDASKASAGDVRYKRISYNTNIIDWICMCLDLSNRLAPIREVLFQYEDFILQLTNQSMDELSRDRLFQIMSEKPEATEAIYRACGSGYLKYIFENYVYEELEKFASERNLTFTVADNVNDGFTFSKAEWTQLVICIYREANTHYIGVSGKDIDFIKSLQFTQMDCLDQKPTDLWPYGWQYLKFNDWTLGGGITKAMISGDFAKHIKEMVDAILVEIENKNLRMS